MKVLIIEIVVYTKPTDEHQYLLRSSCHPSHTKWAFPFSLALRIWRICSFNETFKLHCNESTQAQYLNRRGYDLGLLSQEIQRVHTVCTIKHIHTSNSPTRIPRVVGYHPATRSISSIFHKHKYNVYVHSTRRSNCIVMNQHKHNTLTDVDTISVSSARRYNVFIQCVLSNTFTQATHPHVSLELLDTTQPLAQYLLFFTNTNTFSHPPNFVLLCLNIYLSLPSYVLSSQKSSKWTSDLEPDLSINVMVLYTVQSPLFSRRSSRASATGTHPDWV